jgi:hypothetical protein
MALLVGRPVRPVDSTSQRKAENVLAAESEGPIRRRPGHAWWLGGSGDDRASCLEVNHSIVGIASQPNPMRHEAGEVDAQAMGALGNAHGCLPIGIGDSKEALLGLLSRPLSDLSPRQGQILGVERPNLHRHFSGRTYCRRKEER